VSQGVIPDQLILYIPVVITDDERRLSEVQYLEVDIALPMMVKNAVEMATLESASDNAESAAISTLWIYIVLAILLKGVMGMMWGLFQALQIITIFPLYFVKVPSNVVMI